MLRQVVCVDRVKMLHVTSWDMAGVKTDVTCYVKLFGVDRVKMDLQRPKAKPVADAICVAVAIQKKHLFRATGRQLHKEAFG